MDNRLGSHLACVGPTHRLASDPNATIRVTVEITADFPWGVGDAIERGVSENATSLGFGRVSSSRVQ
jgi:hypothetical protein